MLGTTEHVYDGAPENVKPLEQEVDYLLEGYQRYFPEPRNVRSFIRGRDCVCCLQPKVPHLNVRVKLSCRLIIHKLLDCCRSSAAS